MKRIWMSVAFLLFGGIFINEANAEVHVKQLQSVNSYLDDALSLVKTKHYDESVRVLDGVTNEIRQEEMVIKNEQTTRLVQNEIDEARAIISNGTTSYEKKVFSLLKVRYLTDVLEEPKEPMWIETKGIVESKFQAVYQSIKEKNELFFQMTSSELVAFLKVLKPSIEASVNKGIAEEYEEQLQQLSNISLSSLQTTKAKEVVEKTETIVNEAFYQSNYRSKMDEVFLSFLLIVSCIIVTLIYVAIRKYRFQKINQI